MMTGGYGGGSMWSMHGGMDENERGYGTKIGGGTSNVYYGNEGYTETGKEGGKTFLNRYRKQSQERYLGRSGTQMRSYHKSEEEIVTEKRREKWRMKVEMRRKTSWQIETTEKENAKLVKVT